jgi:hypothetical protein
MRFSKNSILRKKPLTLLVAMVTRSDWTPREAGKRNENSRERHHEDEEV